MSKILIGVGACAGFAGNQFVFLEHSYEPEPQKKIFKPVVEETIVPDGLRMLVLQFVDDKPQSFVVTSRFR